MTHDYNHGCVLEVPTDDPRKQLDQRCPEAHGQAMALGHGLLVEVPARGQLELRLALRQISHEEHDAHWVVGVDVAILAIEQQVARLAGLRQARSEERPEAP